MGLEIGFNIYKKEKKDGKIILTEQKLTDKEFGKSYSCGRCNVNYSWGEYFECSKDVTVTPTFDEELDGYKLSEDGYSAVLKYVPYKDFKDAIVKAINEERDSAYETKRQYYKRINEYKTEIQELRELQKSCTESQEYAFNRWEDQIGEKKDMVNELEEALRTFDEDDYDMSHANYAEDLLKFMEEKMDEGFVTIPYYSY